MDERNESDSLSSFADKMITTINLTRGARFAAQRRLLRKHQLSILSVSMLSIYVIAVSITPIFLKSLGENVEGLLAFTAVIASIFIIVLSHVQAGLSYTLRAERMFKCAQKMSELYYALKQKRMSHSLTETFVDEIRKKYCDVLNDYSENHDDIDFLYFSYNSHPNPPTARRPKTVYFLKGRYYAALYYGNILMSHALLIIIPPFLIALFFYYRMK